jgi:trans-2,3-dihydro-3-hydroxyanthranilate isomerase
MPDYPFLHLDVFTTRRLEGNQLAVIFDATEVTTEVMQLTAREMAFSETVFVLPAETAGATARLRIFTPTRELPMAGHPTVGSTFALAYARRIPPATADVVLDLGIGPTRVALDWQDHRLAFAWMSQPRPAFEPPVSDRAAVAAALGLPIDALVPGLPVQTVTCGLPYVFVPLVSREAVDKAWLETRAFDRMREQTGVPDHGVFVFTVNTGDPQVSVYSRMFAPGAGVPEDPATGSASGPLGCYLVEHGVVSGEAQRRLVSLQGVKMLRPSRIAISIDGTPGHIEAVRVGGASVVVAEGIVHL